jgi:hypothetical protein
MENGRGRETRATGNGGRTTPGLSLHLAHTVEAAEEDPGSAESAINPPQTDGPDVARDFVVVFQMASQR